MKLAVRGYPSGRSVPILNSGTSCSTAHDLSPEPPLYIPFIADSLIQHTIAQP